MAGFELAGTWRMTAAPDAVWEVLSDLGRWGEWWPAIRDVRTPAAPGGAVPDEVELVFDAPRPLHELTVPVRVTSAEPPSRLAVASLRGGIEGEGELRIERDGGVTAVRYAFDVRTTRLWLKPIESVLRAASRSAGRARLAEAGDRLAALAGGEGRDHDV